MIGLLPRPTSVKTANPSPVVSQSSGLRPSTHQLQLLKAERGLDEMDSRPVQNSHGQLCLLAAARLDSILKLSGPGFPLPDCSGVSTFLLGALPGPQETWLVASLLLLGWEVLHPLGREPRLHQPLAAPHPQLRPGFYFLCSGLRLAYDCFVSTRFVSSGFRLVTSQYLNH